MPPYAHITPATDTTEIPAVRRGTPVAEQETHELLLPLRPAPAPAPRWSWLARILTALLVADVAGVVYVAVTA